MRANQDFLLYPLAIEGLPACPACGKPMKIVAHEARENRPDFSKFRCTECNRSETFVCEEQRDERRRLGWVSPANQPPKEVVAPKKRPRRHLPYLAIATYLAVQIALAWLLEYARYSNLPRPAELTFDAPFGANYVVRLVDAQNEAPVISYFIRGSQLSRRLRRPAISS